MKTLTLTFSLALALSIAIAPGAAVAQGQYTGSRLLEDCTSPSVTANMFCDGFIQGVRNGHLWGTRRGCVRDERVCIPIWTTNKEAVGVVVDFLKANPSDQLFSAAVLIVDAHREAWPCEE